MVIKWKFTKLRSSISEPSKKVCAFALHIDCVRNCYEIKKSLKFEVERMCSSCTILMRKLYWANTYFLSPLIDFIFFEINIVEFASFGIWFWFWFCPFSNYFHHRKSFRVITPRTSFCLSTTTKCRSPSARKISNIFATDAFSMALWTERFMNIFKFIEYAKSFWGIGTTCVRDK